jgi:long-chain acyl-CoA synthetase
VSAALPAPPVLRDAPALPGGLLARVHGAAAALRARGAGPGSRIAIGPSATPEDTLAWLLGADVLGAAALVVAPAWTARERDAVLADAVPELTVDGAPPPAVEPVDPHPGDDVLFYLATTSGSSDRPKVLARTRRSWRIGFDALGPLPGPVLLPGPPASSLYLFGALHALHHGADVRWRPQLHAADVAGAGTVHLVPAMLSALLDAPPPTGPRVVVSGGAALGPSLRARCARLLPDTALVEYYGAAECSLMALRRGDGPLRPLPGVDVRTRDGELEIRTPQAFAGYLRSGRLEPAGTGFLRLGDRGALTADGDLVVHGRGSATVAQGGMLVAAEEVEDVLRAVPGVGDVVVAGTPHERLGMLVTAVVEAPHGAPALRSLRAAARAGLAAGKRPRRWLVTGRLPRLTSGKVARSAVAADLARGTLDAGPFPAADYRRTSTSTSETVPSESWPYRPASERTSS